MTRSNSNFWFMIGIGICLRIYLVQLFRKRFIRVRLYRQSSPNREHFKQKDHPQDIVFGGLESVDIRFTKESHRVDLE